MTIRRRNAQLLQAMEQAIEVKLQPRHGAVDSGHGFEQTVPVSESAIGRID
jgi:hypothetical protein